MSNRPSKKPMSSQRVGQARNRADQSRTMWIVGAVVVVIAVALVIAFAMQGGDDKTSKSPAAGTVVPKGDTNYGTVEVVGASLPEMPETPPDPAIGQPIPSITGQQFDGTNIAISADGKPKVIVALAHWCPHCQREVPLVQKWLDKNGMPDGVELVAVSTAATQTRPNWPAGTWLSKEGWTVPTLVDDEQATAATALGLSGFPYLVAVDANGDVVFRMSGETTEAQFAAIVDSARTGQLATG